MFHPGPVRKLSIWFYYKEIFLRSHEQKKTNIHIYSCLVCLPKGNNGWLNKRKQEDFYTQSNKIYQPINHRLTNAYKMQNFSFFMRRFILSY